MILAGRDILYRSSNLMELYSKLENMAFDYVCSRQVIEEEYYEKSISGKWGKVPFGYFMCRKSDDKITVYYKYKSVGYIYTTIEIKKIIAFTLIKPDRRVFENTEISSGVPLEGDERTFLEISSRWTDVHQELLKKLEPKDEEDTVA